MMKGRAPPASKPAARPEPAFPAASTPVSSSSIARVTEEPQKPVNADDPMAFYALMKKSTTPKPSTSGSASTASSGGVSVPKGDVKMAVPASWLAADTTATEQEDSAGAEKSSSLEYDDKKVMVKESYEYAGQRIEIERKVDAKEAADLNSKKGASGLGNLLDQLKGKNRITTLQKSKLDWNQFTDVEGLEDEFVKNRKDGYLGKQEFLQSVDAAEHEAARQVRAKARSQRTAGPF